MKLVTNIRMFKLFNKNIRKLILLCRIWLVTIEKMCMLWLKCKQHAHFSNFLVTKKDLLTTI